MNLKFEKWQDFNNLSVKVTIRKKIYDAILIVDANRLILKVDMTKDISEWRQADKNYDILSGKFLFENHKIFFINCLFAGHSSHQNFTNNTIENLTVDFHIDRLLLGKNISKTSLNRITQYSASYKNLDLFFEQKPMMSSLRTFDYDSNTHKYKINTSSYLMNIFSCCSLEEHRNSLSITRKCHVEFKHTKSITIKKALENIYTFRNFLMIILKQPIYVKKQTIYINDNSIVLFDCNDNDPSLEDANLEEMISHRCLKIENIDNIEIVYNNFINEYTQLFPFLELYYDVTQYNIPNLTRFINATTMLEYYSRTYDFSSAFSLSRKRNSNCNDANYIDMVFSLLNNVNSVYNYTSTELNIISQNIKAARIHYIHYKAKNQSKILTDNEQFHYSYFIQDVVLLNIYKLLGLDITKYDYISFNEFYYDKFDFI